jgi:hypothetical protein
MKKTFEYAYVALIGLLSMAAISCTDEFEYGDVGGVAQQDPGAFFVADATSLKYSAEDAEILNVILMRTDSTNAETISLSGDNSSFQVPATVNFSANELKKIVAIPFHINGGTTQTVTIAIAKENATVYGADSLTFTITRDFVWEYLGEGVFTSWLFGESWTQPVYRGEGTHLYKLTDCIAKGYDITFELTEDDMHLAKPIGKVETGYVHSNYGMISAENGTDGEGNLLDIVREDNIIYLPLKYTVSAGSFGSDYDSIELPE